MLRICRVERRGDEHEVNSHFFAWCQTLASYPPAISPLAMRAVGPCLVAALDSLSPRREAGVSFLLEKMVVVFIQRRESRRTLDGCAANLITTPLWVHCLRHGCPGHIRMKIGCQPGARRGGE